MMRNQTLLWHIPYHTITHIPVSLTLHTVFPQTLQSGPILLNLLTSYTVISPSLSLFLSHSLSKQDVCVSAELPEADQHKADDQIAGLWSAHFSQRCDRLTWI